MDERDASMLVGQITTLQHHFRFGLVEIPEGERGNDRAPTHEVMAKGAHGQSACIGQAWRQSIKHGLNKGAAMFSLVLDDPSLGIRAAAFPHPVEGGRWVIQTERPRGAGQSTQAGQDEAAHNGQLDDGIPF